MMNSGSEAAWGSYADVQKRILTRLRAAKLSEQMLAVFRSAYREALAVDNLGLSRVEKQRLSTNVLESVLTEVKAEFAGGQLGE
jgi:hypothetical protein